MLIALKLADVPGAVIDVLEVINKYDVKISFLKTAEKATTANKTNLTVPIINSTTLFPITKWSIFPK